METTTLFMNMTDTLSQGLSVSGAKAYNLAHVKNQGFRVPEGIVIPCDIVASISNDLLAKEIFNFLKVMSPGPWAVRSSGIAEDGSDHSFAGQFESILNVQDEAELKDAIDKCVCSASSAQVVAYGKEDYQPIALLVQQMVNADSAGVAFSANPITGERNEILINAVKGLGDKLVSGEVTPDEYIVQNGSLQKGSPDDGVLSEKQVLEVAAAIKQLEENFGCPQDVEWAIEDGSLFILQSRPITALPPQPIPILLEIPKGTWKRDDHHTTISPMGFTILMIPYAAAMKKYFCAYGLPIKSFTPKMIGGHLYVQMEMEGGDQKGTPPGWVMWLVSRLLPPMRKMNKTMKKVFDEKLHHKEMQRWYDEGRPYFEKKNKAFAQTELTGLTNDALLERWYALRDYSYECTDAHADRAGNFIAIGEFYLFCKDHLDWDIQKFFRITAGWSSASSFVHDSLTALCKKHFSSSDLSENGMLHEDLNTLFSKHPEFKKSVDEWIKENALRMQDYDLVNPTLGENPELIYKNIHTILMELATNPTNTTTENPEREAAFAEARQKLASTPLLDEFEELAKWCKVACSQRDENGYFTIAQPCGLLRLQLLEMAKRMRIKNPDHIFFLNENEVVDAFTGKLSNMNELLEKRLGERQWAIFHRGPKLYGPPEPPMPSPKPFPEAMCKMFSIFAWLEEVEIGNHENEISDNEKVIIGRAASAGIYKGKAKIIQSPKDFDKIEVGDIMVCRITSGEWSMVFSRVGALVTEEGGMLSHPAIIAREFGIPAVVGTEIAMAKIQDGMEISVDGFKGLVTLGSN
jgi:pyruvate,water dikinase